MKLCKLMIWSFLKNTCQVMLNAKEIKLYTYWTNYEMIENTVIFFNSWPIQNELVDFLFFDLSLDIKLWCWYPWIALATIVALFSIIKQMYKISEQWNSIEKFLYHNHICPVVSSEYSLQCRPDSGAGCALLSRTHCCL